MQNYLLRVFHGLGRSYPKVAVDVACSWPTCELRRLTVAVPVCLNRGAPAQELHCMSEASHR
jgi:hypothetical protein